MTGNAKLRSDAFHNLDDLSVVRYHLQKFQSRFSIFFGVKRKRWSEPRYPVPIAIISFFFLEAGRIRKQYAQKFRSAARTIDRTSEPLTDETRQIAGVIDVRVGEQHCIDRAGRKWSFRPIPVSQRSETLKETTIDQHALLISVD